MKSYSVSLILVNSDPRTGTLALIFELMDMNVYELIKGKLNMYPYLVNTYPQIVAPICLNQK